MTRRSTDSSTTAAKLTGASPPSICWRVVRSPIIRSICSSEVSAVAELRISVSAYSRVCSNPGTSMA